MCIILILTKGCVYKYINILDLKNISTQYIYTRPPQIHRLFYYFIFKNK
jgi:hypothetical protein